MLKAGPAKKLVVVVNEVDRWHGRAVHMALLELLRDKGVAGATVTRGIAGFTRGEGISTANIVDLGAALPIRIEVVDTADAIDRVLPDIYDIVERGLVEVQDTHVIKYASKGNAPESASNQEGMMRLIGKAKMLRVHIGEKDTWQGEPLFEAIVKRARQLEIAGATVYRGILGYGAHGHIHRHRTLTLSPDDPIMVSVIDTEEKIDKLLMAIDGMVKGGCLIAISDVTVVKYADHADPESGLTPSARPGDETEP